MGLNILWWSTAGPFLLMDGAGASKPSLQPIRQQASHCTATKCVIHRRSYCEQQQKDLLIEKTINALYNTAVIILRKANIA